MPHRFGSDDATLQIRDVWTGSLVLDEVSGASSSGSGFYSHLPGACWSSRRWGHFDELGPVGGVGDSCGGFCSALGPVQRAWFGDIFLPCKRPKLFTWELTT